MCKIFTIVNGSKVEKVNKLINLVARELQYHEQDGFGYTIQAERGIYGERTIDKNFKTMMDCSIVGAPFGLVTYNRFGSKSKCNGAMMFHGRTSTNSKSLINTHPINKHGWSLIHNGVVSNQGKDYTRITSNDTEHLVEYMATQGIKGVEENLTGYYAFTAIDDKGNLHVVKDSNASLYFTMCETLGSYIFATSKDMIIDVCKAMDWKYSVVEPLKDNMHLIFTNNELVHQEDIKQLGRTSYENQYASRSLGYNLSEGGPTDYDGWEYYRDEYRGTGSTIRDTGLKENITENESIELFLQEVNELADDSYVFKDYKGNDLTYEEFMQIPDEDKIYYTVIRSDGTVVDAFDYYNETLYHGEVG